MLRKLSLLKSLGKTPNFLIYKFQIGFAAQKSEQYTFEELYEHKWLEYDPTHKVPSFKFFWWNFF